MTSTQQFNNLTKNIELPPHNILAEEIIIGHILYDSILTALIIDNLNCYLFLSEKHKILYINAIDIYKRYGSCNIYKIVGQLWNQNLVHVIGGTQSIVSIVNKSYSLCTYYTNKNYIEYFINILYSNYTRRLFIQYGHYIIQISYLKNINIQQIYSKAVQYIDQISKIIIQHNNHYFNHLISQFLLKIYTKNDNTNDAKFLSGLRELDKITHGFTAGNLIVIAGRPSMGKTSLAINIAYNLTMQLDLSVHIFSLEMSKYEILDKLLSLATNISINKLQGQHLNSLEWSNLQAICLSLLNSKLIIDDGDNDSIDYIKIQSKNSISKKKLL